MSTQERPSDPPDPLTRQKHVERAVVPTHALSNFSNEIPIWLNRLQRLRDENKQRQQDLAILEDDTTLPASDWSTSPDLQRDPPQTDSLQPFFEAEEKSKPDSKPRKERKNKRRAVYFDGHAQSVFTELVKFVSAQHSHRRQARMAALEARINKLDEEDDEELGYKLKMGDDMIATDPSILDSKSKKGDLGEYRQMRPAAHQISTVGVLAKKRTLRPRNQEDGVWDRLGQILNNVQRIGEQAAYQCLRDGGCDKEIGEINGELVQAQETITEVFSV
ncbi:hypothetical protein F4778DRAFT_735847 [Xylariomycetidae sp. FL2044]|nr:hypothetical protein F4778DRAFT_735847 [Xylariomycetidae sp. FL2044]